MSVYFFVGLTNFLHKSALVVGPCCQDVCEFYRPAQATDFNVPADTWLDLNDALLCSHCLCGLAACTNNAFVRTTVPLGAKFCEG